MPYELISFKTDTDLAQKAAAAWVALLENRVKPYNVAISGGRIARAFFSEVTRQAGNAALFQNVNFFWADERCVPPADSESNYAIGRQLLFEPLKIPATHIHRIRGEGPESQAVEEAVAAICRCCPVEQGQPILDMIFLGMGENGHVASLFPEESEEEKINPAIYRAVTATKPPPRRITLGYLAIAAARKVWVLAAGPDKKEALRESFAPNGKTPLARILRLREGTKIFSDIQ